MKSALAATALMLALSSPVFAEGGTTGTTGKGTAGTSAYTRNDDLRTDGYNNGFNRMSTVREDSATTRFMGNENRNFRRNSVNGDNNGTSMGERAYRATANAADDDFNWGWLGLLGLIGLAGLRGRNRETS